MDVNWRADAACKGIDPDLFYPDRGESAANAIAVCSGCPVAAQCLSFALENMETVGVWGGKSERQRRKLRGVYRREHGIVRKPVDRTGPKHPAKYRATCGSTAGHSTHRYWHEQPCQACLDAVARAKTVRKAS